jgi:transglutaminase-like putative cysteine protease
METHRHIAPLLLALGIALLPHVSQLPLWVVLWCLAAWGYLYAAIKYHLPKPGKFVRLLLTTGGVLAVALTSGARLDRNTGIALLWIMASIKPMETRTYRDEMVIIFMAYFLAVACLFFSSNLAVGLYMTLSICITTAVLIHIRHPAGKSLGKLGLAARLMLKALPLALILFVMFPRIHGSLWGMRSPTQAFSGFSDQLDPGTVTHMVRSNAVAFRAEFENQVPSAEHLYWRGLVFWHFDGRAWHRGDQTLSVKLPLNGENSTTYTITLEPHNHRWLFALDLPYESEPDTNILSDRTITSRWAVRRRGQYRIQSYLTYSTGPLREWELAALKLPRRANRDAQALARRWRNASANPARMVDTALDFFRNNNFSYTLNPPPLGENSIDDFLFRTRKGYCEHYASAFAYLMRAAGVPARLVAGYLGGELNPYGGYLIVRQSDAHVWVEVWLPGRGWVRVDPTLAVAPQRVAQGAAAALPPEEQSMVGSLDALGPYAKYWINLRLGWDAINNQWNRWVLGYSNTHQKALLAKIGIKADTRKGLTAAIILTTILMVSTALLYFLKISKSGRAKKDAVQKAYLSFCTKLARSGLVRRPFQGPLDYAETVQTVRPDLKTNVLDIVNLYIRLRYGRSGDRDDGKRLKKMVRKFDP